MAAAKAVAGDDWAKSSVTFGLQTAVSAEDVEGYSSEGSNGGSPRQPAAARKRGRGGKSAFKILQRGPEPATAQKGAYGAAFAKSQRFVEELRGVRRAQKCQEAGQVGGLPAQEALPAGAFGGSPCPLEQLCGLPANRLPCAQNRFVKVAFGNATDVATVASRTREVVEVGFMQSGTMLGYPSMQESGYETVPRPAGLAALHDEEQRKYFKMAVMCNGLTFIRKPADDHEKIMMSFLKDDVPGTVPEVQDRLKKLLSIEHINVVRLVSVFEDEQRIYLVYEGQSGLGLLPLTVLARDSPLPVTQLAKLCQQLSAAVAHAHKAGVYQLDWSLWSVVSSSFEAMFPVRLLGVGLAGTLSTGTKACVPEVAYSIRTPYMYASPELCRIFMDESIAQPYRKLDAAAKAAADVWAIGVIAYTCALGHPPFGGPTELAVLRSISSEKPRFGAGLEHIDRLGRDFLESLLAPDARHRLRVEDAICNSWVVQLARSNEDREQVHKVVGRMAAFAKQPPVMRTVGRVLKQSLRIDKLRALEGLFHSLDVRGDGEIEPGELGAYFVNRTHEIRALFKVLDLNSSAGISIDEFVLCNIFGQEVLTERMLLRTFEYLDLDGTGEITATELYSALKKYEPNLQPSDIGEFMGDCDRDWDADIDFDEFRGFFPGVKSNSHLVQERVDRDATVQAIGDAVLKAVVSESRQWRAAFLQGTQRAVRIRETVERDDLCERAAQWCKELSELLKDLSSQIKDAPRARAPDTPEAKALEAKQAESRREIVKRRRQRLKDSRKTPGVASARDNNAVAERQRDEEVDPFELDFGGPLNLDHFFAKNKHVWLEAVSKMSSTAHGAINATSKSMKRQESVVALEDIEAFCARLARACEVAIAEQECLWQAACQETALPRLPYARRGLVATEAQEEDAVFEVHRFKEERRRQQQAEAGLLEAREALRRQLVQTDVPAAHRGFEWLEKRAAKARERGLPPPEVTRVLDGASFADQVTGIVGKVQTYLGLASAVGPETGDSREAEELKPGGDGDGGGGGGSGELLASQRPSNSPRGSDDAKVPEGSGFESQELPAPRSAVAGKDGARRKASLTVSVDDGAGGLFVPSKERPASPGSAAAVSFGGSEATLVASGSASSDAELPPRRGSRGGSRRSKDSTGSELAAASEGSLGPHLRASSEDSGVDERRSSRSKVKSPKVSATRSDGGSAGAAGSAEFAAPVGSSKRSKPTRA